MTEEIESLKNYEDDPKSIKYYVKRRLLARPEDFAGRVVVDVPAGNGVTSRRLLELGAEVKAFDLFPEYFRVPGLKCTQADLAEGLPLEDDSVDVVICQEGLEHMSDQHRVLVELSRVLKPRGRLLLTTPNYSNLRSKLSYLLSESERYHSLMPPNEVDSIWMNEQTRSNRVYFGHVFLIGILKLRLLARLAGFKIEQIHFTRAKTSSIFLMLFLYPFIFLSNLITLAKNLRKAPSPEARRIYRELFALSIHPKILVDGHLFVEFVKVSGPGELLAQQSGRDSGFGQT